MDPTATVLKDAIAAVSVGIVDGVALLDLCYAEDVRAEVDANIVMTGSGHFVEVQGTAEGLPFSPADLQRLLDHAQHGIRGLLTAQARALSS